MQIDRGFRSAQDDVGQVAELPHLQGFNEGRDGKVTGDAKRRQAAENDRKWKTRSQNPHTGTNALIQNSPQLRREILRFGLGRPKDGRLTHCSEGDRVAGLFYAWNTMFPALPGLPIQHIERAPFGIEREAFPSARSAAAKAELASSGKR